MLVKVSFDVSVWQIWGLTCTVHVVIHQELGVRRLFQLGIMCNWGYFQGGKIHPRWVSISKVHLIAPFVAIKNIQFLFWIFLVDVAKGQRTVSPVLPLEDGDWRGGSTPGLRPRWGRHLSERVCLRQHPLRWLGASWLLARGNKQTTGVDSVSSMRPQWPRLSAASPGERGHKRGGHGTGHQQLGESLGHSEIK